MGSLRAVLPALILTVSAGALAQDAETPEHNIAPESVPKPMPQPAPATTDADVDARINALFAEAKAHIRKQEWALACPKFEEAHRLRPTGGTRLQLARCYEHTDRLEEARTLYQEVIDGAATETVPERIAIASERLRNLEERLSRPSPEPIVTPQPDTGDDSMPGIVAAGAVLLALGGGGFIAGAVFGGLALSEESAVRDECGGDGHCPETLQGDADAARTKAIAADICFGVSAAVAATGLVLLIVGITSDEEPLATASGLQLRF